MKDYEDLSRKHFNKQAKVYDETDTTYYSKEGKISCKDIASYLKNNEFKNLLDVGCGTGYLIEILSKEKEADYHGLDLSEEMIKVAKSKDIPNSTFIRGTADNLPYKDNTFDIVCCSQSFHHYPYQEKAIKEANRVLKPNGLYILSDTGVGGILAWFDNHIIFPLLNSGDYKTTDKEGIAKMMEKENFTVIEKKQIKRFLYTVVGKK